MPKQVKELGHLAISKFTKPGLYTVGGVAGLALRVYPGGTRSWLLRYMAGTKRRELGLGSFPTVALADARVAAREARIKLSMGNDPIDQKRHARIALIEAQARSVTFRHCAEAYIASHEGKWRNEVHRKQVRTTLKDYAYPVAANLIVQEVQRAHVVKILRPLWDARKFETARRLRGRIEAILNWAAVNDYRTGDNPARWHGYLNEIFTRPHDAKVVHHRALPFKELPGFIGRLRDANGIAARALEFLILTAARSGEVRNCIWADINFEERLWIVPAHKMKANKQHEVPLSLAAINLLRSVPRILGSDLVFPAPRSGTLSDMTLSAVLRRMKIDATVHGFRSSFRDWAGAETDYQREVAEFSLAHGLRDKTEASYFRDNLLGKRRSLMSDWAAFCEPPPIADVISIQTYSATYKG
jgi:integrase